MTYWLCVDDTARDSFDFNVFLAIDFSYTMTDHTYVFDRDCSCNICKNCGATDYSGWHWLAGYRSKIKPPCEIDGDKFYEWKKQAELPDYIDA